MPGVLPLPSEDYLGGHIPGAVFFDVNAIADPNDPRPHMYPDAGQFARDVSALGISSAIPWSPTIPAAGPRPRARGGCFFRSAIPM